MSVYVLSSQKNVLNVSKLTDGLDINTRNQFNATIFGLDAGVGNEGDRNVFIGYKAGNKNKIGKDCVYLGSEAGQFGENDNNVYVGSYAGKNGITSTRNVILGTYAGLFNNGNYNILIGYKNTDVNLNTGASSNIGIGNEQINIGHECINIGRNSISQSRGALTFGNSIMDKSRNSIIMGNNIRNEGSNAVIIRNIQSKTSTNNSDDTFTNESNNYTNFNDILVVTESNNEKHMFLQGGDIINIVSGKNSYLTIGETVEFSSANTIIFGSLSSIRIGSLNAQIIANDSLILTAMCNIEVVPPAVFRNTVTAYNQSVFNSNLILLDKLRLGYTSCNNVHWDVYLRNAGLSNSSDLIMKSCNNTMISFTDDFSTEILNFTGKHRCSYSDNLKINAHNIQQYIGRIVVSEGVYKDLDDVETIKIDEALPVVTLCKRSYDSRVFGVICGLEEDGDCRNYKIGNIQFGKNKNSSGKKVIINSHGEGGIWVCNANGNLKNGDLITSSHINGYAMRQGSETVKSYTVGKITCDCVFTDAIHKVVRWKGYSYLAAFVGCVYKV